MLSVESVSNNSSVSQEQLAPASSDAPTPSLLRRATGQRPTFAAAAAAIRFSNTLMKKNKAAAAPASVEDSPLRRYPSRDRLPVTRGASVSFTNTPASSTPETGVSFETTDSTQGQWETVLAHHGGMSAFGAAECAHKLVLASMPPPTPGAARYLTHDLLKSVGISAPGDRARVLLAVARMPQVAPAEAETTDGNLADIFRATRAMAAQSGGSHSAAFSADSHVVRLTKTNRGDAFGATWVDLVGDDSEDVIAEPRTTPAFRSKLAELQYSFPDPQRKNSSAVSDATAFPLPALTLQNSDGDVRSAAQMSDDVTTEKYRAFGTPGSDEDDHTEVANAAAASSGYLEADKRASRHPEGIVSVPCIWDVLLREVSGGGGVFVEEGTNRVAFVLQCDAANGSSLANGQSEPDQDVQPPTGGARTADNWTVLVDTYNRAIATVHRRDSMALAGLRMHNVEPRETFTLKEAVASVVGALLIEIEMTLDECSGVLDDCEATLLDHTKHTDLIDRLFDLERRAARYARSVDFNQLVVATVAGHMNLGAEFAGVDEQWHRLRAKTSAIKARARSNLLMVLELSGHRTNNLMSALTKPSVIFIPLNFVTGWYGMRFYNMPELEHENSYFYLWGFFLLVMLVGAFVTWRL